jgi:hypothetical protein
MNHDHNKQILSSVISLVLVLLLVLFVITGCSTAVPVSAKFPDAPGKNATVACPQLQKLKDDAKLSDVANTVALNYETYYGCAVKADAWIEWYEIQKRIFENAGK